MFIEWCNGNMKSLLLWAFVGLPLLFTTSIFGYMLFGLMRDQETGAWLNLVGGTWIIFGITCVLVCLDVVFLAALISLRESDKLGPGRR